MGAPVRPPEEGAPVPPGDDPASRAQGDPHARDPESLAEVTVEQQVVYEGSFLKVRRDMARLPTGRLASREFVLHPGAAAMVPIGDD